MTKDILELAREAGLGTVLCHNSVEGDRVWIEGAEFFDAAYEAWYSSGMDLLGGDWNTFASTLEAILARGEK